MTDAEIVRRFGQLREFCETLVMGSDPEGLDILLEVYPEIWLGFTSRIEQEDVLCDHDDMGFRTALALLIGEWVADE